MESVIKKIGKDESFVFIETQHGKIRVNYSLEDLEQIFKELFGNNKSHEIGVDFKFGLQGEKELPLIFSKKMIKSALISLGKSGYDISSILNGQTEIKGFVERWDKLRNGLPFYIEINSNSTAVCLIPQISIVKHGKKDYWVEIILPSGCLELVMDNNCEVVEIKKVESYVFLRNTKMVKIERGILQAEANDDTFVRGAGFLAKLNIQSMFERSYNNGEKVLGVIVDNKFNLCHEFELIDGEKHFGYIVNNGLGSTAVRTRLIQNFNIGKFDPYNSSYELGEEKVFKKEAIKGFSDEKTERE